jgi:hypothetical protein
MMVDDDRQRSRVREVKRYDTVEELAKLEHEQWMHYSKAVSEQIMQAKSLEELQLFIKEKWFPNWKDYSELSEEDKNKDRMWARKALRTIKNYEEKSGKLFTG